ncbi:hypothetical protein [Nostoc sp. FACHB-110]|uniref:hypothetical protein n=1 Tax=Nostoc sp. FACHB-110 TaxID=2692834 RepID=UPI0016837A45|nr:hypothetical protein [Nostoc sp. FACHB-110]MBD2435387.1 hypothetical protein [Nostoc sp. FACHB-110]
MDINNRKQRHQFEINDLIDDAVEKAVARRNQALESEDSLLNVSDEHSKKVIGGAISTHVTSGIIAVEK